MLFAMLWKCCLNLNTILSIIWVKTTIFCHRISWKRNAFIYFSSLLDRYPRAFDTASGTYLRIISVNGSFMFYPVKEYCPYVPLYTDMSNLNALMSQSRSILDRLFLIWSYPAQCGDVDDKKIDRSIFWSPPLVSTTEMAAFQRCTNHFAWCPNSWWPSPE